MDLVSSSTLYAAVKISVTTKLEDTNCNYFILYISTLTTQKTVKPGYVRA